MDFHVHTSGPIYETAWIIVRFSVCFHFQRFFIPLLSHEAQKHHQVEPSRSHILILSRFFSLSGADHRRSRSSAAADLLLDGLEIWTK